jgi:Protein-tyrosine phosphatase
MLPLLHLPINTLLSTHGRWIFNHAVHVCHLSTALLSHPPIPVAEFVAHVIKLKLDDAVRFAAEYESIDPGGGATGAPGSQTAAVPQGASVAPPLTWEASLAEINRVKNRYANVVAYDHSRVRLLGSADSSDYINANFIDGFRHPNAYIATQVSDQ